MSENSENQFSKPSHYTARKIEPIQVILDWNLGFNAGNVVKYISRAGLKEDNPESQDMGKMAWYANRLASQRGAAAADQDKASHYNPDEGDRTYEAINVIEHYELNFPVGNAVKYLLRKGRKSTASEIQDTKKAMQYLNIELKRLEALGDSE
jgi:hypothetical protein